MRISISIFVLIFSFFSYSQENENSIYFPQEQLIHPECDNADDKNACLYNILEKQVFAILNTKKNLKLIKKSKKDTVAINYTLIATDEGLLNKELSYTHINSRKLSGKIEPDLNKTLKEFPKFKTLNRKSKDLKSKHFLWFKYLIQDTDEGTTLNLIENKNCYKGGIIETIPIFPGCGNADNSESRDCFNKQMQNHIGNHFNYPIEAQKKGIKGKVSIIFTIGKDGAVTNIRTRGPHPILEAEAVRIIKLLPQLGPGTQNGKAVKVPFSIPMTFKLD